MQYAVHTQTQDLHTGANSFGTPLPVLSCGKIRLARHVHDQVGYGQTFVLSLLLTHRASGAGGGGGARKRLHISLRPIAPLRAVARGSLPLQCRAEATPCSWKLWPSLQPTLRSHDCTHRLHCPWFHSLFECLWIGCTCKPYALQDHNGSTIHWCQHTCCAATFCSMDDMSTYALG